MVKINIRDDDSSSGNSGKSSSGSRDKPKRKPRIVTQEIDRTLVSPNQYVGYEFREQIYKVPDTYIGSDSRLTRKEWLYITDPLTNRASIQQKDVELPEAIERLFIEILGNANDNIPRSRDARVDPGIIEVTMDRRIITVKNGGLPIPVDINDQKGMYAPTMVFGDLLTSSNYENDNRKGGGRNGLGVKLVNIFSKELNVMVGDSGRYKSFAQTWKNNMTEIEPPVIQNYSGPSYVSVSYHVDFERFGYADGYPDEAFQLFARHCCDVANAWKIPVHFNDRTHSNDVKFNFQNSKEHAALYFQNVIDHAIHINLYPEGTKLTKKGRSENSEVKPFGEIILIDTPFENHIIPFINGLMTRDGGVHSDAVIKVISKIILDAIKEESNKKTKKETGRFPLTVNDVRTNISFIGNFFLPNPKFRSQTKTYLTSPDPPKFNIDAEILSPVFKWQLYSRLLSLLDQKQENKLAKDTDGNKNRYRGESKCEEANNAGHQKLGRECTLIVVEGGSAKPYALRARDLMENGLDMVGVLPLQGKCLPNAINNSLKTIAGNQIITEIKQALGLNENVDYSLDINFQKLRYGRVLILTDADDDGIHIKGLFYLFFAARFPTLFKRKGFFQEVALPRIRVTHGSQVYKFSDNRDYNKFIIDHPEAKKWTHDYFKGLGSSDQENVEEDFANPRYISMVLDNVGFQSMQMAFDRHQTAYRKNWMKEYKDADTNLSDTKTMSQFINEEFIMYSIADLIRCVPKMFDGLKPVQRKTLWGALKWKQKDTKKSLEKFATDIISLTKYHHGPSSLHKTILAMGGDFVGANNMPYFISRGMFGTRYEGGKDAADPRYVSLLPHHWLRLVFRPEDDPILNMMEEEGQIIEPEVFYPIVPMTLINGARGIGCGHSTYVPKHNPLEIIAWYKNRLENKIPQQIYPWYNDFKGDIEILDVKTRIKTVIDQQRNIKIVLPKLKKTATVAVKPDLNVVTNVVKPDANVVKPDANASDTTLVSNGVSETELADGGADDDGDIDVEGDDDSDSTGNSVVAVEPSALRLITKGCFHRFNNKTFVTELPIGRWTEGYIKDLEKLAFEKKIKGYKKLGSTRKNDAFTNFPQFEITGFNDPSYVSLRLITSYGIGNMTLLDNESCPSKYKSVNDILEDFYAMRKEIYHKRKAYQLQNMKEQIKYLESKLLFVQMIVDEKLIIIKRSKEDVYSDMDKYKIPREHLNKVKSVSYTLEGLEDIKKSIAVKEKDYRELNEKSVESIWWSELDELEKEYRKKGIKSKK